MRRTKALPVLSALAVLLGGLAPGAPARADASAGTQAGAVWFECTARLPEYPTSANRGVCGGRIVPGAAAVEIAGLDPVTGAPYAISSSGAFGASFDYREACISNEPPLIGFAEGAAAVTGLTATYDGSPTMASLHATFSWTRVGVDADIRVTHYTLAFGNGRSVAGSFGQGHATFGAVPTLDNLCPYGGPLEAVVQGAVALAT